MPKLKQYSFKRSFGKAVLMIDRNKDLDKEPNFQKANQYEALLFSVWFLSKTE